MYRSEMNETSAVTMSNCRWAGGQVVGREVAGVDAFETGDAWIGAQPPVHLVVADVEGHHVRGAAPEQHVGEAARGRADVQGFTSFDGDAEGVEGVNELEGASADVRVVGLTHLHIGILAHQVSGLGRRRRSGQTDVAGEDQCARPFARRGESALDEQRVEPDAGRAGVGHWRRVSVQSRMAGRWPEMPAAASAAWPRSAHSRARWRLPSTPNSAG